jgi:hypothetical protein
MEILGATMPNISFGSGGGLGSINWVLILVVFCCFLIGAVVIYLVVMNRQYNKKIILFENISGQGYQLIARDRARLVKVGDGGEEILFLKKMKVYRTAYGRKMGKNTYWFAKGQDGYWYNIVLGNLDTKMGALDVNPIDRDMRYMHVAIRKNIQERYRKANFMEKYGAIMMNGIFLLIMLVGIWILLSKMGDISKSTNMAVETANKVLESTNSILSSLNNVCRGGSGLL